MTTTEIKKPTFRINPPHECKKSFGSLLFDEERVEFTVIDYKDGDCYVDITGEDEYYTPLDEIDLESFGFEEPDSQDECVYDVVKNWIIEQYRAGNV